MDRHRRSHAPAARHGDPRILVLDEAFSALDLDTEARLRERLWREFPDRTVLVISHRPVGLAEFDRILFLRNRRFDAVAPDEARALFTADRHWNERPAALSDCQR